MRLLHFYLAFVTTVFALTGVQGQRISGSASVCSDDFFTYQFVGAGCSSPMQWSYSGGAVLLAKNDTVKIQFSEEGDFILKVKCGILADSFRITVRNCNRVLCIGQNLVPNPSFEDYGNCVTATRNFSLTEVVLPWDDFPKYGGRTDGPSSTDYINPNCTTISEFYKNIGHKGRTGKGFVGAFQLFYVVTNNDTLRNNREYLAVPLRKPLTVGKTYRVRFYTKKLGSSTDYSRYDAIDRIGVRFSEEKPYSQFGFFRNRSGSSTWYAYSGPAPQMTSPKGLILEDTTFWTRIEGRFTADAPYKYLLAGNFFSDRETTVKPSSSTQTGFVSYYIFDDFSVQEEGSGVDFTWIKMDTVVCRGGTANLTFHTTADTAVLKNKNTGSMTPLSITPTFELKLPNLQATTDYDLILIKNSCRDTVPFTALVLPDYNFMLKKTSCFESDTGTLVKRMKTFRGCDSIETIKTVLTSKDTSLVIIYTCNPKEAGSVLLKVKSVQGCDSFVFKKTQYYPNDTSFLNFNTCLPKEVGVVVEKHKNQYGCDSIVLKRTKLSLYPKIELGSPQFIPIGMRFILKPFVSGDAVKTISWTPTDSLSCSDCLNPEIILLKSQTYKAKVVGQNGCSSEADISLKVLEIPYIYVPTVFSPNGDGVNDVLTVYADEKRVKKINRLVVLNRWGNILFEKNDFLPNDEQSGWRGDLDDKVTLIDAVFAYFIEIELHNGEKRVIGGGITLIR